MNALSEFIKKPRNSTKSMNSLSETTSLSEFIENPESEASEPQVLKPPYRLRSSRLSKPRPHNIKMLNAIILTNQHKSMKLNRIKAHEH